MKCMAVLRMQSRRLVHCANRGYHMYERTWLCNEHYMVALKRSEAELRKIADRAAATSGRREETEP